MSIEGEGVWLLRLKEIRGSMVCVLLFLCVEEKERVCVWCCEKGEEVVRMR